MLYDKSKYINYILISIVLVIFISQVHAILEKDIYDNFEKIGDNFKNSSKPEEEFYDGETSIIVLKDDKTSNDTEIWIEMPNSWAAVDYHEPNGIAKMVSLHSLGDIYLLIGILKVDESFCKMNNIKYNFEFYDLLENYMIMPEYSELVRRSNVYYDNMEALEFEYVTTKNLLGVDFIRYTYGIMIIVEDYLYEFKFIVEDKDGNEDQKELYDNHKKLFKLIYDSLEFR